MEIEKIKQAKTEELGKEIVYYETIESTHIKAKELTKQNVKNANDLHLLIFGFDKCISNNTSYTTKYISFVHLFYEKVRIFLTGNFQY